MHRGNLVSELENTTPDLVRARLLLQGSEVQLKPCRHLLDLQIRHAQTAVERKTEMIAKAESDADANTQFFLTQLCLK